MEREKGVRGPPNKGTSKLRKHIERGETHPPVKGRRTRYKQPPPTGGHEAEDQRMNRGLREQPPGPDKGAD